MRVVCLQHVRYESPGAIAAWARARGHALEVVIPLLEDYPAPDSFDMLVVMGGPMAAYDEPGFPWLASEKAFIRATIDAGRLVLGVCLGAQLVACALGGSGRPHVVRELGWFTARLTMDGEATRVLSNLPNEFVVGLWHGDTYELPADIPSAAVTEACLNQAFESHDGRVIGLQFHLEWSLDDLAELAQHHGDWFEQGGDFVQSRESFLAPGEALPRGNELLFHLLDAMEAAR